MSTQDGDPGEQLHLMQQARQRMSEARTRGARQLGALCILLGLVLGVLHGLLHVFNPPANLKLFFVLCGAAALAIMVLCIGYQRLHRLMPAGFGRRYLLGLLLSLLLYGAGLFFITAQLPVPVVLLMAAIVALPLVLTGCLMVRR